jgi:polyhydroxyalkanoate synthesis repressor PhaR
MARIIKRYANRKLYDSSAKRYVKLEELAELVRGGEAVHIIDNESGGDITGVVLSKVVSEMISESARKDKTRLPASVLTEVIQRRSDAVVDYVKQGIAASARAVKDVEEQIQQRWKRATGREESSGSATEDLKMIIQRMVDESVQYLIGKMNLPTRAELNELNARLDEIEQALKMRRRGKPSANKRSRVS